jgi:hypothetical protein
MYKKILMMTFIVLPAGICAMQDITVEEILERLTQEQPQQEQKEQDADSSRNFQLRRLAQKKQAQEEIKKKHDQYCEQLVGFNKGDTQ